MSKNNPKHLRGDNVVNCISVIQCFSLDDPNLDPSELKNLQAYVQISIFIQNPGKGCSQPTHSLSRQSQPLWRIPICLSETALNLATETALLRMTQWHSYSCRHRWMLCTCAPWPQFAFDSVDHHIMIKRLRDWMSISGTELDWFTSYLARRSFTVSIRDYGMSPLPHLSLVASHRGQCWAHFFSYFICYH